MRPQSCRARFCTHLARVADDSDTAARIAAGCEPPAFIARYEYEGDTVYFVPQRCCDAMSVVHRSDGAVMCHADGDFGGTSDGRCPDFFAERKNERIIWRDPRS